MTNVTKTAVETPAQAVDEWTILIVDDDPDVISAIRLAVGRSRFFGRRLRYRTAGSAAEAETLFASLDDMSFALAFVDVVMEHEMAGLELVKKLRDRFGSALQIILNTGQAGGLTSEETARKFEISGYLSKPEATPERLRTLIQVGVRNFRAFAAMHVLCESLSDFVSLFESATTEHVLDLLAERALLQYSAVWRFEYAFVPDIEGTSSDNTQRPAWAHGALETLAARERTGSAPKVLAPLSSGDDVVILGCVVRPLGGRFRGAFVLCAHDALNSVQRKELQVLLRSWALTRESIVLRALSKNEHHVREEMHRERRESIAQMVAGVAHEVNTPLGVANAAAGTVSELISRLEFPKDSMSQEQREDIEDITEGLELISRNIARADELIRSFRKLSVGQLVDRREELLIADCVAEVIRVYQPQARRKGLQIALNVALDDSCTVWVGYAGHLSQILLNLFTNAERYAYGASGGRVEVELTSMMAGDAPQFQLAVKDFGKGIPKEHLGSIFEPFFTTGRGQGGTGLGLSVVHNIVTSLLGGRITCTSEQGEGTSFCISFSHAPILDSGATKAVRDDTNMERAQSQTESLEEFIQLQRKLLDGQALMPDEQMRLADVRAQLGELGGNEIDAQGRLDCSSGAVLMVRGVAHHATLHRLGERSAVHISVDAVETGEMVDCQYMGPPEVMVSGYVTEVRRTQTSSHSDSAWEIEVEFATPSADVRRGLKLLVAQSMLDRVS